MRQEEHRPPLEQSAMSYMPSPIGGDDDGTFEFTSSPDDFDYFQTVVSTTSQNPEFSASTDAYLTISNQNKESQFSPPYWRQPDSPLTPRNDGFGYSYPHSSSDFPAPFQNGIPSNQPSSNTIGEDTQAQSRKSSVSSGKEDVLDKQTVSDGNRF